MLRFALACALVCFGCGDDDEPTDAGSDVAPDDGCSPSTFYRDFDEDGFGNPDDTIASCELPDGYVTNADDCDDSAADRNPTDGVESCNGVDDDCDGRIDEGMIVDTRSAPLALDGPLALPLQRTTLATYSDGHVAIYDGPALPPADASERQLFLQRVNAEGVPTGTAVPLGNLTSATHQVPHAARVFGSDGLERIVVTWLDGVAPHRVMVTSFDPATLSATEPIEVASGVVPAFAFREAPRVLAVDEMVVLLWAGANVEVGIFAQRFDPVTETLDGDASYLPTERVFVSAMHANMSDGGDRIFVSLAARDGAEIYGLDVESMQWLDDPLLIDDDIVTSVYVSLFDLPYVEGGLDPGETSVLLEIFPIATWCARSMSFDGSVLSVGERRCLDGYATAQPVHDGPHTYALIESRLGDPPGTERQVDLHRLVPDMDPLEENARRVQDSSTLTNGGEADLVTEIVATYYGVFEPGDPPPSTDYLTAEQVTAAGIYGLSFAMFDPVAGPQTIVNAARGYRLASDLVVESGHATAVVHAAGVGARTITPTLVTLSCTR